MCFVDLVFAAPFFNEVRHWNQSSFKLHAWVAVTNNLRAKAIWSWPVNKSGDIRTVMMKIMNVSKDCKDLQRLEKTFPPIRYTWQGYHESLEHVSRWSSYIFDMAYGWVFLKDGRGFAHKSTLIDKVLRTSTFIYSLKDLDEWSLFCQRTWSPGCLLKSSFPLKLRDCGIRFHHFTLARSQLLNELRKTDYAASVALETRYKTMV